MLMGMVPEHDTALDVVLRGFLALVREGPTFIDKYKDAVAALDQEYAAKAAALKGIDDKLTAELQRVAAEVDRVRESKLATLGAELAEHENRAQMRKADILADLEHLGKEQETHRAALAAQQQKLAEYKAESDRLVQQRTVALETVQSQLATTRSQYEQVQRDLAALVK